ncbi:MAG: SurA N-terminal domain-containing protein [Verrucomicrobia bacterium]|nr:SurA N-terminal domain-containing protein [Verrucomicrobiota bacterium]
MLVAMRKHTKVVFWIIIILIVPAFVVFYVPQYFQHREQQQHYGSMFGRTVTTDQFGDAYWAEWYLMNELLRALPGMDYRRPQNRVLATVRESLLAEFGAGFDPATDWQERSMSRQVLERTFTDRATGRYDKDAYDRRRRELGMTDEEYLHALKDDYWLRTRLPGVLEPDDRNPSEFMRLRTWRRLVLAHEAERLRIPVDDQDVINYLYFLYPGDDGRLDEDHYQAVLRQMRRKRTDYEDELRTNIRITMLLRTVLDSAKIPPGEADEAFNDVFRRFKLAYSLEPTEPYADPKALRDDEVLAWYAQNRKTAEGLRIAPRRAALYVLVEGKDFEAEVEVEEPDLKDYYEAHQTEFADASGTVPPYEACRDAVCAAVVQRKALALAADKATDLFTVVRSSERLIEAVEQINAAPGAAHQYVLRTTPLFGVEGPIDETIGEDEEDFRQAAFSLDLGEVSPGPVRVDQGWCVLAPLRIEPDETPDATLFYPFHMVRGEARRGAAIATVGPAILEAARDTYKELRRLMDEEGLGFIAACERQDITLTTTGFLGINDEKVVGLDDSRQLILRAARSREFSKRITEGSLEPEDLYVYQVDKGVVFFHILEEREPNAQVRAREMPWFTEQAARRDYVREVFREWVSALEARAAIVDLYEQARQEDLLKRQQQAQGGGVAR